MADEQIQPCKCCGNPLGPCMKFVAEHMLRLPAFDEIDAAENRPESIFAQFERHWAEFNAENERHWAEFNAKIKQHEADHQRVVAKINRRFVVRGRLVNVAFGLLVVGQIILTQL